MFAISNNLLSTLLIALNMPSNCNGNITKIATNIGAFKVDSQIKANKIIDIVGIVLIIEVNIETTCPTFFNNEDKIAKVKANANEIINDNKTLDKEFPIDR